MNVSRLFGVLSGLSMVFGSFTLSGCVVDREHTVERPVPYEGYYDRDHHRWYHENAWVMCDDRDSHCPPR
jgi:hypothetical protein